MKNVFSPSIGRNVSVKTRFRYCLNLNFIPIFAVALLIISTLIGTTATANQGARYNQEVQNAKDSITKSLNSAGFKSFTAEAYCDDASCRAQIQNPKESGYLNDANKMVNDGTIALANDPNAINLVDGYKERPKYDLNPNDPDLQRAKGYMDNSYNISHGISNKYYDCEGGGVCTFRPVTLSCETPTNNTLSCEQTPVATIDIRDPIYSCLYDGINEPYSVALGHYSLTPNFYDMVVFWWNGELITNNNNGLYKVGKVMENDWWYGEVALYETCKLNRCPSGYTQSGGQCLKNNISWVNNCPITPTECTPQAPVCTEGAATKTINGVPTYLDCWKKRIDYQCDLTDSCEPLLNPVSRTSANLATASLAASPTPILTTVPTFKEATPEISNCTEQAKVCGLEILGICLSYDVSLECEKKECGDRNLVCGETSFCLDGDCYEGEGEQNENAAESLAGLAALGAVAEDFSEDNVMIFTGKGAQCDKKPMGLSNCCADSGWGNDIGLTDCSAEEEGLMLAKQDGLTIALGEYCAERVLGVCIRRKKSYCQFDSKMARIIQEQGKVQLGIGFGTKKNPVCTGITTEQMQKLDFSIIDFSDFYEDMESNMNLPDMDLIQNSIKDKFTDM